MQRFVLTLCSSIALASATAASAADTCALVSAADASSVLAQAGVKAVAAGPMKDEDSSGQLSYCTYRAAGAAQAALVVSVVEFKSEAEARKSLNKNLLQSRLDDAAANVAEEGGIGEKSFYGANAQSAMVAFLKKNKVVGVTLGGAPSAKAAAAKETLLKLARSVASRL